MSDDSRWAQRTPPATQALAAMADAMGLPAGKSPGEPPDTRLPALQRMTHEELVAFVNEWVENG